jgi:hypothetical protein
MFKRGVDHMSSKRGFAGPSGPTHEQNAVLASRINQSVEVGHYFDDTGVLDALGRERMGRVISRRRGCMVLLMHGTTLELFEVGKIVVA